MKIGIIAIQGNVAEHVTAMERTLSERNDRGEIIPIRQSGLVLDCDAIVLSGGESTTLARLMWKEGIAEEIRDAPLPKLMSGEMGVLNNQKNKRSSIT